MKSKTTATILCFLLGGFGAHKFYLGQKGKGFLYIIFCWIWIPAIIAFIEFIQLLVMSDDDFNKKYNSDIVTANSVHSCTEEIKKLYELKEKGIITQEEFELKKKTIL